MPPARAEMAREAAGRTHRMAVEEIGPRDGIDSDSVAYAPDLLRAQIEMGS